MDDMQVEDRHFHTRLAPGNQCRNFFSSTYLFLVSFIYLSRPTRIECRMQSTKFSAFYFLRIAIIANISIRKLFLNQDILYNIVISFFSCSSNSISNTSPTFPSYLSPDLSVIFIKCSTCVTFFSFVIMFLSVFIGRNAMFVVITNEAEITGHPRELQISALLLQIFFLANGDTGDCFPRFNRPWSGREKASITGPQIFIPLVFSFFSFLPARRMNSRVEEERQFRR